jgi:hypothetical protein
MIITILIIIILTYYYYYYLQNHFWYNFDKNLGKNKFYLGKLHPNIYSKNNLSDYDKNELVKLYEDYLKGIIIDKEKIEDFLSIMPDSEIFYMKLNNIFYGAVMNSIIEIKYKNKNYLTNFVDYAIINKNYRDKGIFKELMNYVSNYSNNMNAKYIIFKIDKKPIPSFYKYNFCSNYYYTNNIGSLHFKKDIKKENNCFENINQFFKFKKSKNMIIITCLSEETNEEIDYWDKSNNNFGVSSFLKVDNLEVKNFQKRSTTMILKKNSTNSIELLYIYKPKKINIDKIMNYLFNNYKFDIFFVDDIGNNSILIKQYPKLFKIAYPVYHYILGLKDEIKKENFFYYF